MKNELSILDVITLLFTHEHPERIILIKQDGARYRLIDNQIVDTRHKIPLAVDITDKWVVKIAK